MAHDGAGKTVAERIRAATAGLLERLDEWENAFAEWRTMSGLMQRENAALSERVTDLSRHVQSLGGSRGCREDERDREAHRWELWRSIRSAGAGTIAAATDV